MKPIFTIDDTGFILWKLYRLEYDEYQCKSNEVSEVPTLLINPKWDGTQWIEGDTVAHNLEITKQSKLDELDCNCGYDIINNFYSTAYNGENKHYDCELTDQDNIIGNALAAQSKLMGVEMCQNDTFIYKGSGETEYYSWTAEQCLQLARDMKSHKEAQLQKLKLLEGQVNQAITVEEVNNIIWG